MMIYRLAIQHKTWTQIPQYTQSPILKD